jgi:hypothetical protein
MKNKFCFFFSNRINHRTDFHSFPSIANCTNTRVHQRVHRNSLKSSNGHNGKSPYTINKSDGSSVKLMNRLLNNL